MGWSTWYRGDAYGVPVKTIIFAGNYERITENGVTKEMYYIGDAIYVKQAWQSGMTLYTHKDHLGSIISITDSLGAPVFRATYDPWGKQTLNPSNTFSFHRGYTGHEHLTEFDLINMNARLYDPELGRMLQPDMYVANPFHTQDYNRYSYVLNNPLIFTDPSGNSIKQYLMDLYSYEGGGFWYRGEYLYYSSDVGSGGGFLSSGSGGGGGAVCGNRHTIRVCFSPFIQGLPLCCPTLICQYRTKQHIRFYSWLIFSQRHPCPWTVKQQSL